MLIQNMKTKIIRFTWIAPNDFNVSDTSLAVYIPIWGKDYVLGIYGRVKTVFTGNSGKITMKIGTSTDDSCIMTEKDLGTTGDLNAHLPPALWSCSISNRFDVQYNHPAPVITFTSHSGNLSTLTAGEVELIVVRIVPDE